MRSQKKTKKRWNWPLAGVGAGLALLEGLLWNKHRTHKKWTEQRCSSCTHKDAQDLTIDWLCFQCATGGKGCYQKKEG